MQNVKILKNILCAAYLCEKATDENSVNNQGLSGKKGNSPGKWFSNREM